MTRKLGERNAGDRAQDVKAIAEHCKAIAKDFDVPFVALAQFKPIAADERNLIFTTTSETGVSLVRQLCWHRK